MIVRQFKIDKTSNLRAYLQAAETRVDSLSESELDDLDEELKRRIQAMIHQAEVSAPEASVLRLAPRNRRPLLATASVLMTAALVLLTLNPGESAQPWQSKGTDALSSLCEIQVIQSDRSDLAPIDTFYRLPPYSPTYLKIYCMTEGSVVLEHWVQGRWQELETLLVRERFLSRSGGPVDLRTYAGRKLRLRFENSQVLELNIVTGA